MMKCPRCGGLMEWKQFYGKGESFWAWRCLFCGDIVDEMILENRFLAVNPGTRRKSYYDR